MSKIDYNRIKKAINNKIAEDIRMQEKRKNYKSVDKFDSSIFSQGMDWFNSGLTLDDAPENIKDNTNFINGFNRAKRIMDVEKSLYALGVSYFYDGTPFELIPENYRENPTVLRGYEEAKVNSKSR